MTKRRNLVIIIALVFILGVLCGGLFGRLFETFTIVFGNNDGTVSTSNSEQETEIEFEPFVMLDGEYNIEKNGFDKGYYQYILYDPETKVMYTLIWCHARGETGITVIYNADGTPKLYDPEEEKTE